MFVFIALIIAIIIAIKTVKYIMQQQYEKLEAEVLKEIGLSRWNIVSYFDEGVTVKSRQALEKYDYIKFFKEDREKILEAERVIKIKTDVTALLAEFLKDNKYKSRPQYKRLKKQIEIVLRNAGAYRIGVTYYISSWKQFRYKGNSCISI